ncbi:MULTISPECIES: mannose-6-phosphate isomerase, class I [Streptococcus]|uniref:Mannose-6-phosphate isomerase n=1 Tax=Streptococcus caledonicus TaxID=2614158 RepID=A0ABW0UHA8_9STRE|nr:mannose-6-phosphate isomerase, class I [Streptococcus sp. S784/96/1]
MNEPLFLTSQMHPKIWGGTKLRDVFGYTIPSETTGEYWAISAHPNGVSIVANGEFAGQPLDKLYREQPQLFGNPSDDVFPLLTKILDANDWLSVQVHPDDAYGLEHEGELGKTECWYVIASDEGAEIIYGHQASSKQNLQELIEKGDWDNLLTRVPVKAGDFFYVPSGTIHAIGKGIMILETQQSSDTTYRVYDFDRKDDQGQTRELHLQQSIDVTYIGQPQNSHPATLKTRDLTSTLLVSNEFFTVYHWVVNGRADMQQTAPYLLVSVLDGKGEISSNNNSFSLKKGDHFIIPNAITEWTFSGQLDLIASHISEK